ncbi:hypothetical protein MC65_009390 [Aeromonas caviae]|nr:hypothetical protein MC65_009390 [Aeromonas caviae]
MAAPAISIRNLDHLGLVAALCQELGIARMIDALLPKTPPFKVSHGEALVAMIAAFFKIVVAQSCFKQPLFAPARVSRAAPDLASRHR